MVAIKSSSSCSSGCTLPAVLCWFWPLEAEVGYLLARESGAAVEALSLTALADGDFQLIDLTPADFRRAAQLVQTYADLPHGTTDATVAALAERLGIREVVTLDRRHFTVVRPSHLPALTFAPGMIVPTEMPTLTAEFGGGATIRVDDGHPF